MRNLHHLLKSILILTLTLSVADVYSQSKAVGIWQLTVPSRNDDGTNIGYLPYWKIYSSDGTFTIFFWKSATEGARITSSGTYTAEGDSVITEHVSHSTSLAGGTVNRIRVDFISCNLMNTHHFIASSKEKWQELWQKVSDNTSTSDMAYIKMPKTKSLPQRDLNGVYFHTDHMPYYPGGEKVMLKHIEESINYPSDAIRDGLSGTSIIRFIVNEKGKPESLQIIRSSFPPLDSEAARVIRSLTFVPGTFEGKKVKVYYTIPVKFKMK